MTVRSGFMYDATGRVVHYVSGAQHTIDAATAQGETFMEGDADHETEYVLDGALAARPEMPVAQAGNTLTVPLGTEFLVLGPATAEGVTEDGVLEFEFAEPGTYTVTLRLFPYLDAEVTLEG